MARLVAIVLIVVLLIGGAVYLARGAFSGKPQLYNTYHAILLSNGQVYFGKVEGLGNEYTQVTSVYYVHNRVDPDTKQPSPILIKRGREWHAPDRMIINTRHIIVVEPLAAPLDEDGARLF